MYVFVDLQYLLGSIWHFTIMSLQMRLLNFIFYFGCCYSQSHTKNIYIWYICINSAYLILYYFKDVIFLVCSSTDTENILYSKHGKQIMVSDTTVWCPRRSTAPAMVLPAPLTSLSPGWHMKTLVPQYGIQSFSSHSCSSHTGLLRLYFLEA